MTTFAKVVSANGHALTVQGSDGRTYTVTGDRNLRNNNPGNIEAGAYANSLGAIGSDGRFAVFPDYTTGQAAQADLQFNNPNYSGLTIQQAINKYAPPSENNSAGYAAGIARALGVPVTTPLSSLTAAQRQVYLQAQQNIEGGRPQVLRDGAGNLLPPGNIPNVPVASGPSNESGGPDDRSTNGMVPPNVTPIPLAPLTPTVPANSSGSPDDRGSGGPFSYTTPPPATAPVANASGSPDDRNSTPVPSLPNPYKPSSGGPFSYTTPPPAYAAPNSSGSPDDRSSPTPGVQRTNSGIAGTVQLPSGVRPITVPLSSSGGGGGGNSSSSTSSQGGGYFTPPPANNDLPFSYAAPPSSYAPPAANSSGSPDDRDSTTYTTQTVQVANPAYTAWMNNQSPISPFSNPGVQGLSPDDRDSPDGIARAVPGLTSSAFATPAPPKTIARVIRVPVARAQAAAPVAQAPIAPVPIASTNGYTYLPNGSGGYTRVGSVNPNLTPAAQYAAAAAPALNSQPSGGYQAAGGNAVGNSGGSGVGGGSIAGGM